MKKQRIIILATMALSLVSGLFAQEFLSRHPRPDELDRVAGVRFPLQGIQPNYQVYLPGDEEQYDVTLGGTNQNVIFASASTSNVQVRLPNCTNSVGASFLFISGANTIMKLTNVNGNTFTDRTNFFAGNSNAVLRWTCNSNQTLRVFTPNGTNWFVL